MARIRTIKPEFWSSEQVMECSPLARLLFIGLWNFCDDGGNHPVSERTIKALVFPGDSMDSTIIRRALVELSSNALLQFYEVSGKVYLNVIGWKHQKIDRPTYKYPDFSEGVQVSPRDIWAAGHVVDEDSSITRRGLDEASPPEGKGRDKEKIKNTVELSLDGGAITKTEPPKDQTPYDEILAVYREVCAGKFLGAEVLNKNRKRGIRRTYEMKILGEYPFRDRGMDFWRKYFSRCTTNSHWCGDNPRNWKADLEFVTREDNVLRVLGV